jgi:hypothetical protein
MTHYAMPTAEFTRIFGAKAEETGPGRTRLCKSCGGWHPLDAWPHNCRRPAPPRSNLAAPLLAPRFDEFVANKTTGEIVGDRKAKREFMERNDLVEYDEGVKPEREQTELEWTREFVADFKRAQEEDPLNRPPVDVIGQTDTADAGDIDMNQVEVFK